MEKGYFKLDEHEVNNNLMYERIKSFVLAH